ncbi:MAG: glycosyltransferase [Paramuribaculum sp.]|nr:glycosyltransferase [Paramuribaculum sp.]
MTTAILITDAFPLGAITEGAFVVPEIEALSEAFGRVIVMPTTSISPADAVVLPANVEICYDWVVSPMWRHKWRRLAYLFTPGMWRFCGSPRSYTNLTFTAASMAFERFFSRWIEKRGIDLQQTVIETFWLDFPAAALGRLRNRLPHLRYVNRAHGHDVYTRRAMKPRSIAIGESAGVYCASDDAADYLREIFPEHSGKISTAPLGCVKLYPDEMATGHSSADRALTFLSVARVYPGKGVARNLEMLRKLAVARPSTQIRWIHIGDGPLMSDLRAKVAEVAEPNLSVELRGAMPNPAVQRVLFSEPIDWIMLLSDSEGGRPISICEAMAYGIPAIATEVGGVPEIVDDDCGLLLAPDSTTEEFVRGLLPYLDSNQRTARLREGAYTRWHEHYNAPALRQQFVSEHLQ